MAKKCGKKQLLVRVPGYRKKDGSRVKGYSYCVKDRGAPGRGKKVIQKSMGRKIAKGKLTGLGYSIEKSALARRRALAKAVKKYGYKRVRGMLGAQIVFRKRSPGETRKKFKSDFDWLVDKYHKGGK